jgi:repressor LexA
LSREPALENLEGSETLAVPQELAQSEDTIVLKVKGDSMLDEQIRDGDFLLVQKCSTPENGASALVLVDGEAAVKRFYREGDGMVRLESGCETIKPTRVRGDRVEVRGTVIAVIRKY